MTVLSATASLRKKSRHYYARFHGEPLPQTKNASEIADERRSEAFKLSLSVPEMGFV